MRTVMKIWLMASVFLLACESTTGPEETARDDSELQFVRFPIDLAPLADTTASVWAVKGEDRELVLRYRTSSGPGSDEFMRFEIPKDALLRRPDGSLFQDGDSVLITVHLGSDRRLLFDFEPSGLRFSAANPARLRISWGRLQGDLDGDGNVTAEDSQLELLLRIWRREGSTEPWFPLGTIKDFDADEVRANITGFTGFVIAA